MATVKEVSARRGSLWTGAGLGTSGASTFVMNLVVVGSTAPAVFADLSVVTFIVFLCALILRLGADNVFVGEVGHSGTVDGPDVARKHGARLLARAVLFGTLGGLLLWAGPLAVLFNHSISAPLTAFERGAVGIWLSADVIRLVCSEAHRSRSRFAMAAIGGVGVRAPLFLLLLVAAQLVGTLDRSLVFGAAAAASAITLFITLPSASRAYPWWRANPLRGIRTSVAGHSLVLLTTLSASLVGGADIWIISDVFSPETTARYAFAVAIVSSLAMLSTAAIGGLAPAIARLLSERRVNEAQSMTVPFVRLTTLVALLGLGCLGAAAQPVAVRVGGDSYVGIWVLVLVLGAGQVLATASGIGGWVLILGRRYSDMAKVMVGVAVVAVAAEAAAAYGIRSALLVSFVSMAATFAIHGLSNFVAARRIGLRTDAFASRHRPQPRTTASSTDPRRESA